MEFDNAVNVALQFAKSNSYTLVIVCPDHGNGGISIGNAQSHKIFFKNNPDKYEYIDINERIITPLKQVKCSARKLAEIIVEDSLNANSDTINKYFNIKLSQNIIASIRNIRKINSDNKCDTIQYIFGSNFSANHFIGWTTSGHTAEDVFLGIYAPQGINRITGVVDNSDIASYIAEQLKLGHLQDSTENYFCSHKKLFQDDEIKQINLDSLIIRRNEIELAIFANTNSIRITKKNKTKEGKLPTVAVCIPKENKQINYYIPKTILKYLE